MRTWAANASMQGNKKRTAASRAFLRVPESGLSFLCGRNHFPYQSGKCAACERIYYEHPNVAQCFSAFKQRRTDAAIKTNSCRAAEKCERKCAHEFCQILFYVCDFFVNIELCRNNNAAFASLLQYTNIKKGNQCFNIAFTHSSMSHLGVEVAPQIPTLAAPSNHE